MTEGLINYHNLPKLLTQNPFYSVFNVLLLSFQVERELFNSPFIIHNSNFILARGEGKLGDCSDGETPGSIPNPAVKPASADGT
jgi:hypothetical protein